MERNRGKIRETKGTFHAKMGIIKDRNGMYPTEAEDIKKRRQEYTDESYKKGHNDPDNHDSVTTYLEADIQECEIKRTLGSITTNKGSEGDGIPAELFQILKADFATLNMAANLENLAVATGLVKFNFHSSPKEGQCQRMVKLPDNCSHFTC